MTLLQSPDALKRTPLYDRHVLLHGKIVDFSGWALPVYYSGIIAEHRWVREHCGFFDVSHLGEIEVKGPGAFEFLQKRLTSDLKKCPPFHMIYAILCDGSGYTLDDILVYRGKEQDYHLIVNASNIARDEAEFKKYAGQGVEIQNHSDEMACIAVQGPDSERILEKIFGFHLRGMEYYTFKEAEFQEKRVWISRSGYTGEDGFELFALNDIVPVLWDVLAGAGKKEGALPAGLGARNTLRLEAGNPLYGHEMNETTTPLEAGLGFAVSWEKGDFVGREAMMRQKQAGLRRRLVGFRMIDKAVARDGYKIFKGGRVVGHVTSGSYAPSVDANIGMAYVSAGYEKLGDKLEIEIHGRLAEAEIVKRPFVTLKHKKN